MLRTRNLILVVAAIVIAGHVYSSTVDAQLLRRNRRGKSCCQTCCPTPPPKCCAPAPTCPPVQCCPGTAYAPIVNSAPACCGGNQWMAAPNPCNVWIADPNNQGVIIQPDPDNGGGDQPPILQTCLEQYNDCRAGCASCTGQDAIDCQSYCSAQRNNCTAPPGERVRLPTPPACYQPPGVDPDE